MKRYLAYITIVVDDYDKAIDYYTQALGFDLLEDTQRPDKRWVRVSPSGNDGCALLLAKASNKKQTAAIGNQTGGRVGFFMHTDDFNRDYALMQARQVNFIEQPRNEAYGKVVVFEDLYGNRWDLIELKP